MLWDKQLSQLRCLWGHLKKEKQGGSLVGSSQASALSPLQPGFSSSSGYHPPTPQKKKNKPVPSMLTQQNLLRDLTLQLVRVNNLVSGSLVPLLKQNPFTSDRELIKGFIKNCYRDNISDFKKIKKLFSGKKNPQTIFFFLICPSCKRMSFTSRLELFHLGLTASYVPFQLPPVILGKTHQRTGVR